MFTIKNVSDKERVILSVDGETQIVLPVNEPVELSDDEIPLIWNGSVSRWEELAWIEIAGITEDALQKAKAAYAAKTTASFEPEEEETSNAAS